jgi:hypothetical protein
MTMREMRVTRQGDRPGQWSAVDGPVSSLLIDLGQITYELTPHESGSGFELRVAANSMGNVVLEAENRTQHILNITPTPVGN